MCFNSTIKTVTQTHFSFSLITVLHHTIPYSRKVENWSKSDYVINAGPTCGNAVRAASQVWLGMGV